MLRCQYCNATDSRVIDSRPTEDGASIRRRRECNSCGKRFTTYEKVEMPRLLVVKKDNTREVFDINKIRDGIIRACHKRPVAAEDIDAIAASVEQCALNTLKKEITTQQIGGKVMDALKSLDEVAYIRFASVYRQFTDLPTFLHELTRLMNEDREDRRVPPSAGDKGKEPV